MFWRIKFLLLIISLAACHHSKNEDRSNLEPPSSAGFGNDYLIEAPELIELIKNEKVKIIDFRKKEIYAQEHLKGALNMWRSDIEDSTYPYGGMMASKQQIERLFSKMGINTSDILVIYDDNGLCDASRLWWILQNYDFTQVKLLHGGLTAWKKSGGAVTQEEPLIQDAVFKLKENASMKYFISKEEVQKSINRNITLLDTRSIDEFSGKKRKKGAAKGGRIPNSINIDWSAAIDYDGDKKFKSIEDLEAIYTQHGMTKDDTLIVYCHSGVRSAHTTFVLTQLLAFKHVKNYDGSWTEWSSFNNLSYVNDSKTTIIN